MNKRQITALAMINTSAREIQAPGARVFYMGRIIEFLTDIVALPTDATVNNLVNWVDNSDQEKYKALLNM